MWVFGDNDLHDTTLTHVRKMLHLPDKLKHAVDNSGKREMRNVN